MPPEFTDRDLLESVLSEVRDLHKRFDKVEKLAESAVEQIEPVIDIVRSSPIGKMMGL